MFFLDFFGAANSFNALPSLDTVTFTVPAAASLGGNVVCGFIRGTENNNTLMNSVREWLPGPEDTSGIHFDWTPIHGILKQMN